MSKITKSVAVMAALPILAISSSAFAGTGGVGQIEQGDIYRSMDVTTNSAFADNTTASCGDTVAFRVRIHNGGPATLTNVKVAATLDQSSSTTSHGSQVSLSADNNLHNAVVTANTGVQTASATTASYVSGSTELLNYSVTPGNENVIANLPDGILNGGINIGSIGPLTSDTEEVQFEAKLNCPTPTPPVYTCDELDLTAAEDQSVKLTTFKTTAQNGASFTNATIDWGDNSGQLTTANVVGQSHTYANSGTYTVVATANFSVNGATKSVTSEACQKQITFAPNTPPVVTPPTTPLPPATPPAAPTALVNTGAGNVVGIFAAVTVAAAAAYRFVISRRLSRQ